MGRWSQRTRAGGGKSINFITSVAVTDTDIIQATYLDELDASAFELPDFDTLPGEFEPASITNISANQIELTFNDPIDAEAQLTYQGQVPGILNPQSVDL